MSVVVWIMPVLVKKIPDTFEKLNILSQDSRFDLACACATSTEEHRTRSSSGQWIYPVVLPGGGTTYLLKTLMSNVCVNDCGYCPLRSGSAHNPCHLTPEEVVKAFFAYYRARKVSGLFLSSAVSDDPDATMQRINTTAAMLRRMPFKGYIHLKIIPGASDAAIRQSLSLATTVSLNVEAPGEENFRRLSRRKDYNRDIMSSVHLISRLTAKNAAFAGVKQTTQFVVGASGETDREIIRSSWDLYRSDGFNRVYFSAYQRGAGDADLPGERSRIPNNDLLAREHRLYQVDWLIRKYGFQADEIPVGSSGNLSLDIDPKEMWARAHPEFFPVHVNDDDATRLLRVPGLGHVTVDRITRLRQAGARVRSLADLGSPNALLKKAAHYITF